MLRYGKLTFQAIQGMTQYPSPVIASELARTVLVENYYYRVRMEAARALVAVSRAETIAYRSTTLQRPTTLAFSCC